MQLFLSGLHQIVFYIFYLSPFIIVAILWRTRGEVKTRYGSATTVGCISIPFVAFLLSLGLGYYGIGLLPSMTYYVGLLTSIVGYFLIVWGRLALGRYFSPEVLIYNGHKLVERGPYRLIRHPTYSGYFFAFGGMGLAVQSWAAAIIVIVYLAIVLGYRIRVEEKALIAEFGEQYIEYSKRARRLFPYIY